MKRTDQLLVRNVRSIAVVRTELSRYVNYADVVSALTDRAREAARRCYAAASARRDADAFEAPRVTKATTRRM